MGEVVVLSSEELEGKESDNVEKKVKEKKGGEGSSSGLMRWEKFLPKMALRVLLVEADDSTGQIVAALLRKCNYKVAAVADGLKAWEVLKGRPHKIDLILTEVDLPSISGYALLTLIMEHEICRNIPVIMMSPEDSVSTVYQCMLRGASDYLVKPLRINELRTLWQHVWRRQRQKVEAASANNAACSHSSDRPFIESNKEYVEDGSEAQSSCTKPDLEAESAGMENKQECFQSNEISPRDAEMQKHERLIKGNWEDGYAVPSGKDVESEAAKKDVNITSQASGNNDAPINSTIAPAGSSGAFYGLHNCRNEGSYGTSKFDSSPQGGLSLSRSHLPSFESKTGEGRKMLKHSNTSAFTQYVSRPAQHLNPTSAMSSCQHKEYTADSDRTLVNAYKSDTLRPLLGAQNVHLSLATSQSEQSPLPDLHTEQRTFSVPVPVSSIQGNYISTIYDSVLPPVFSSPSGLSPLTSPSSAGRQVHVTALNHTAIKSNSSAWFPIQTKNNQEHDRYHMEEPAQISPATDQSPNSSFCNVGVNQHNSSRYDSICGTSRNIDPAVAVKAPKELNNDGSSHRLSLREAALIKFRQKRKDRCYEKKVRYESRKKLAEQRPRVKGQFVRQVHVDTLPVEPEDPKVNSADA